MLLGSAKEAVTLSSKYGRAQKVEEAEARGTEGKI